MTLFEPSVAQIAHESIDHRAPEHIRTRAELDAEVRRIAGTIAVAGFEEEWPARRRIDLSGVRVRPCPTEPSDPTRVADDEFADVTLPHVSTDGHLHFRLVVEAVDDADAERGVLIVRRADYEATVYVDGVRAAAHRGYIGAVEVPVDARAPHQVDIVVRRARDAYRWSGESEGVNLGDAHGKGLGSAVGDAVTAGVGIAGVVLELRPPAQLHGVAARGGASGELTIDLSLTGQDASARVRVCVGDPAGQLLWETERAAGEEALRIQGVVAGIAAWSPAEPTLYRLHVEILQDGRTVDEYVMPLGFRSVIRADDGSLTLNGAPLTLRGTTTIGCVWEAADRRDDDAVIHQLLVVRALFGNVLRVHVAVPDERLYALADRYGVLIYQDGPYQWHCFESRRDELGAELEQVRELGRHLQNHPSVIVASVPNEMHMKDAFHDSDREFVERAAEILRAELPDVIHLQDWSGGTRPRVLPQAVHDYPGYFYATTGATTGVLDNEDDPQLDGPARVIVSEYGGGAVASWEAMIATRASHAARGEEISLPATPDGRWSAEASLYEMTGELIRSHQRLVGWRPSFEEYRRTTGEAQARVLQRQTGRLRRDRGRVSGVIQHYLQNPGHYMYNPWVDLHVIDSAGELTAGFDALRDALRPVAVEVLGMPARAYGQRELNAAVWIYNDLAEETPVQISWTWDVDGEVIAAEDAGVIVAADSSVCATSIAVTTPNVREIGDAVLRVIVSLGGRHWVSAHESVQLYPAPTPWDGPVEVLGDREALLERAGDWLAHAAPMSDESTAPIIVTPDVELSGETIARLNSAASRRRAVILLERGPGDDLTWISKGIVSAVMREQPVETANIELSMQGSGLSTDDLSRWASPDGRVVTHPLMGIDRRGTTAWARCGHGLQLVAIQESARGGGLVLVCQMLVWSTLGVEPMAARVLGALLNAQYRPI